MLGPAKILPGLIGSFAVAGVFWHLTRNVKIFGGTIPHTNTKEWAAETERRIDHGWTREGGPPTVLNPISRQNYKLNLD